MLSVLSNMYFTFKKYEILFDGNILKHKDMGRIWISPGGLGGYKNRYD